MKESVCYIVNGYALLLHPASYLVEVLHTGEDSSQTRIAAELPAWIFHSKYAIWLTLRGASIFDRAREGEKIRKEIQSRIEQAA